MLIRRADEMKPLLVLALLGFCCLHAVNAQGGTVLQWLDQNAKLFSQMVKTLDIKVPVATVATVLVPSDKAVEAFLKGMMLTREEFLSRQALVDLVLAYHVIPGYQAKSVDAIKKNPTIAVSADVNYILRFHREPAQGGKPARAWVQDVQDNNVTLQGAPILLGKFSVIKIDKVLMSGGYFFSGLDALTHYPQWTNAFDLAKKAGWPTDNAAADLTMFVPDNQGLADRKFVSQDAATAKQQLLYHFVAPAKHIPNQLASGKVPTLLKGRDLTVAVTKKPAAAPEVVITPELGPAVKVVIFNIYAGKGILQGIDGNLQAKLPGTVAVAKPAASGRRLLLAAAARKLQAVRKLLRRGRHSNDGYNQATVNSIAASNTQQAIRAAADGNVPVSSATRYGSYQAQAAAEYNSNCWNCRW